MLKEKGKMKQEQAVVNNENIRYKKYNTWSNIYSVQSSITTRRHMLREIVIQMQ